jgi:hypothetical protein
MVQERSDVIGVIGPACVSLLPTAKSALRAPVETGEMLRMKEPYGKGVANHAVSESCAARP